MMHQLSDVYKVIDRLAFLLICRDSAAVLLPGRRASQCKYQQQLGAALLHEFTDERDSHVYTICNIHSGSPSDLVLNWSLKVILSRPMDN
jgi:hypothetical protein